MLWWELGHWQLLACRVLSQQYPRMGQHRGCQGMPQTCLWDSPSPVLPMDLGRDTGILRRRGKCLY